MGGRARPAAGSRAPGSEPADSAAARAGKAGLAALEGQVGPQAHVPGGHSDIDQKPVCRCVSLSTLSSPPINPAICPPPTVCPDKSPCSPMASPAPSEWPFPRPGSSGSAVPTGTAFTHNYFIGTDEHEALRCSPPVRVGKSGSVLGNFLQTA